MLVPVIPGHSDRLFVEILNKIIISDTNTPEIFMILWGGSYLFF
jgi:hypothetical protein